MILINLINEDRQENRVNCLTVTIGKGGGAEWMETRFRHSFEQKILKSRHTKKCICNLGIGKMVFGKIKKINKDGIREKSIGKSIEKINEIKFKIQKRE